MNAELFWFLTVIVSMVLCSMFIYNVVQKWKTSPVIVTVNGRLSSVGSVPFPSVTICPQMKVNPLNYNYTEKMNMFNNNESLRVGEEYTKFINIGRMCDAFFDYDLTNGTTNSSMVHNIIEAAPSLDDLLFMCKWQNKVNTCSDMLSRVITEDGVCYTVNSLKASDIFENSVHDDFAYTESNISIMGWSMEGYNYSLYNETFFPRRGRAFYSYPDLSLTLINDPDKNDSNCNQIYSGYKIYLHHPADFPQISKYFYAALPNQLSSLAISFHELNSDSSLIEYPSKTRQCFFQSNRKLRYFKIYTAKNCEAECLSNYTYYHCGCVGFYMPFHNSNQICSHTIGNRICLDKAKDIMANKEIMDDKSLKQGGCNCLPACNTIEYDAEILKTDFRIQELYQGLLNMSYFSNNPSTSFSRINLFYKKPSFVTMQRREMFGVTDLLANIGGLLGLFLGFSFLSLVEIIYFLTVRVGFILKRDLDEEKTKEKSKLDDIKTS